MKAKRHARGATLVEVFFAFSIFAIILLGLASFSLTSQRANAVSSELAAITAAASSRLEDLKSLTVDDIKAQNGSYFRIERSVVGERDRLEPDPQADENGVIWPEAGRVTVARVGDSKLLLVTIRVRWRTVEGAGQYFLNWGVNEE